MSTARKEPVIRTILRLRPKDEGGQALARFYQQELILERAVSTPGCLAAEIALPRDADDVVVVTAVWETLEAYHGWVNDPWRQRSAAMLSPLLTEDLPGTTSAEIYEVAHAVTPETVDGLRATVSLRTEPAGFPAAARDTKDESARV